MAKSLSDRVLATPSSYARKHYLYVQEIGTLTSMEPHVSRRQNLSSYLFLTVQKGEGYLTYQGHRHFIQAGDCIYINCQNQYAHESTAEHPWTLMWVHFNGNGANEFYETYRRQERSFLFRPADTSPFTERLAALYALMQSKPSLMELCAHRHLTDLITLCFTENRPGQAEGASPSPKLVQVRQYLEEHYMERICLTDLSALFFISKYHLSREYKKNYGITIGNDLTARRISHAKSLLRFSDSSVEEIALLCGFSEAGYFIRTFKKTEGMTPLEYRRKW